MSKQKSDEGLCPKCGLRAKKRGECPIGQKICMCEMGIYLINGVPTLRENPEPLEDGDSDEELLEHEKWLSERLKRAAKVIGKQSGKMIVLSERIEQLEKQNAELRQSLENIKKHIEFVNPSEIGRKMSTVYIMADKALAKQKDER